MSGELINPGEESSDVTVSVNQADISEGPKQGILVRLLLALCECVIDSDYHETLANDESQEDSSFLPPQTLTQRGRNTLVLDLDETLIHSALQPQKNTDFTLTLESDGTENEVYVAVRPGASLFLARMAELFEVVLFTASTPDYANPIIDLIDQEGSITFRLFRSSCQLQPQGFLKDLSRLGRDLQHVLIVDVIYT